MTAPSAFKFSLQCGAGNTWVDVTADVLFEEGPINFTDGRTSNFDGFNPGTFPFTLANGTGKYTPNSPLTTLAVPLSEGMGVCMQIDGLLLAGTIRSAVLVFPALLSASNARVRVTVDDMIGNAARHSMGALEDALFMAAGGFYEWPFTDAAGSSIGHGVGNEPSFAYFSGTNQPVFGSLSDMPLASPVLMLPGGVSGTQVATTGAFPPVAYGAATFGAWGIWFETDSTAANLAIVVSNYVPAGAETGTWQFTSNTAGVSTLAGPLNTITGPAITPRHAYFLTTTATAAVVSGTVRLTRTFYLDGATIGTYTADTGVASISDALKLTQGIGIANAGPAGTNVYVSRFTHSRNRVVEEYVAPTTASNRLVAIAATAPEITFDTVPTMSSAILSTQGGDTTATAMGEVLRGEQGYMWVETTGTLLAPVPKIKTAARNRERAIDYTFDVSEILDPIPLVHSLTNTLYAFTANGPLVDATYANPDLVPLVGSASSSDSVLFRDYNDLYAYASDRISRGYNPGIDIASITIDATSPLISRWADLIAIRQGHRLHITGLPVTQLGYSTWDGFVAGREIVNTQDSDTDEPKTLFTFNLSPWSLVSVLDTARLAAGTGVLSLQSTITSSSISIGIVSTGELFTTTPARFPLDISIGSGPTKEIVTLSAVSGASSPQTGTISARGVGVAPATAWTAGAAIDISPLWKLAY